jgi:hypothetical protein
MSEGYKPNSPPRGAEAVYAEPARLRAAQGVVHEVADLRRAGEAGAGTRRGVDIRKAGREAGQEQLTSPYGRQSFCRKTPSLNPRMTTSSFSLLTTRMTGVILLKR